MGYWGSFYPVSVLGHSIGKELATHAGEYTITFHQEVKKVPYSEANKMLYFTGWGLTAEGMLKPDVTLPGGNVYSAIPDGSYDLDAGTRMATPHAAGATALIKQALEQRFPNYSPEQIHTLLRQLVMSTAKPHFDQESKSYSSVRQQGSGLMDAAAAAFGDVFVTGGKGTTSSLTLGNVKDSFTFDVTVHNLSSEAKEFTYHTVVNTDQVENGRITLKMRQLLDQEGEKTIHVPAMGSVTVPISVNTSNYTSELTNQMKNGYF
ncbi:MAG: S8 family serine peptidase [Streptococcus parasanguinis]